MQRAPRREAGHAPDGGAEGLKLPTGATGTLQRAGMARWSDAAARRLESSRAQALAQPCNRAELRMGSVHVNVTGISLLGRTGNASCAASNCRGAKDKYATLTRGARDKHCELRRTRCCRGRSHEQP